MSISRCSHIMLGNDFMRNKIFVLKMALLGEACERKAEEERIIFSLKQTLNYCECMKM